MSQTLVQPVAGNWSHRLRDRRVQAAIAFALVLLWTAVMALNSEIGYDTTAYLAAGERLNAGHFVYTLLPGDRFRPMAPPYWNVALLYPPLIAVLWRPLAALPAMIGYWAFIVADAVAILWATAYVLKGLRADTIALIAATSFAIGLEVTIGNVAGFLVAGYVVCWRYRDRPWIGLLIGFMTAIKVTPGILILWLIGQRRGKALAYCAAALLVCLAVGTLGSSFDEHLQYLDVIRTSAPQPLSLTGLTGFGPATLIAQVVGVLAVLALRGRPAWSFRVAILTMLVGSPAVGFQTPAILVAMGAPRDGE
jgi:alpha-1,2-mannosyltransferase